MIFGDMSSVSSQRLLGGIFACPKSDYLVSFLKCTVLSHYQTPIKVPRQGTPVMTSSRCPRLTASLDKTNIEILAIHFLVVYDQNPVDLVSVTTFAKLNEISLTMT